MCVTILSVGLKKAKEKTPFLHALANDTNAELLTFFLNYSLGFKLLNSFSKSDFDTDQEAENDFKSKMSEL